MARGGKRPGAGRKKGSVNKLSAEATRIAAEIGKLPHEILLEVARGGTLPGRGGKKWKPTPEQQLDAAKAAAPYYAPRLMAAAVKQMPADWNPYAELMESVKPSRGLPFKPVLTVVK